MDSLRRRLNKARKETGATWEVLERDYVLSWVLAGIASVDTQGLLVLKGGTALKKCYFGSYRFSEDLDFTVQGSATPAELDELVHAACTRAQEFMREYSPSQMTHAPYCEANPHPSGQKAYVVRTKLPWHADPRTPVMIEISVAEPVLVPPQIRPILHQYGEPINEKIPVYTLEEVVAEKLRAILEHTKKIHERGWTRSRARDYYDLWQIFSHYRQELNTAKIPNLTMQKCQVKQLAFSGVEDFFTEKWIASVKKRWEAWLRLLTPNLPPCDEVLNAVKIELTDIFAGSAVS